MSGMFGARLSVLALVVALPSQAQTAARAAAPSPAPAPAARPRIGYAAQPAPAPAPVPLQAPAPIYVYSQNGYVVSPDAYIVNGAPYQALSDGSVLVNFGNGYERVLRPCAQQNTSNGQVNQTGRDALGRIGDPPGIAALKAGTRGQASGGTPAQNAGACYRSDAQGRVSVVTR